MFKTLKLIFTFSLTALVVLYIGSAFAKYVNKAQLNEKLDLLKVPSGFTIKPFAGHLSGQDLSGARLMAIGPDGHVYLTLTSQNKVVMLPDFNNDGIADEVVLVADQVLNAPHGIVFVGDQLYVANQDSVVRFEREEGKWPAKRAIPIIEHLPTGGHTLKSLKLGPDKHLYINVGSSCNVCVESDAIRATILRYTTDGKPAGSLTTLGRHQQSAIWASGLRNSQGFNWHPKTQVMYATNNGSDNRSEVKAGPVNEEVPPEHFNQIEAGKDYGWPYCWGDQFMDPNFSNEAGFCQTTQAPAITFTSHSTPIGFSFLNDANVPATFKNDALVALHGSWNREQPSGYALARVIFDEAHQPIATDLFITGWLQGKSAWGRPVDVIVGTDHAIYLSDDEMGLVYRLSNE
jgi:glucose/arabinose dehydrogenase